MSAKWEKTRINNLFRYVPTGEYVVRRRSGRVYLDTTIFTVARWKMAEVMKTAQSAPANRTQTLQDAADEWLAIRVADQSTKPNTARYLTQRLAFLKRAWEGLGAMAPHKVRDSDIAKLVSSISGAAPSTYNGALVVLRGVFDRAVERGMVTASPMRGFGFRRPTQRRLALPTQEQFAAVLDGVARSNGGQKSADLVALLAFSGMRVGSEAAHLTWADVDFTAGQVTVVGDPKLSTKSGRMRTIPMIPELRALLEQMRSRTTPGQVKVLRVFQCPHSLETACRAVGIPTLTHHDLRHLFATRCLSAGVDVTTLAQWLGHRDGGITLLKVYSHLMQDHSTRMAAKVRVGSVAGPVHQTPSHANEKEEQPGARNQPNQVKDLSHAVVVTGSAAVVE